MKRHLLVLSFIPSLGYAQSASFGTAVAIGSPSSPTAYVDTMTRQVVRVQAPGASSDNTIYICGTQTPSGGTGSNFVRMFKGSPSGTPTSFVEEDTAHHPTDGGGTGFMAGADCRLAAGSTTIFVAYQEVTARTVYFNTFDTLTNTWGTQETVGTYAANSNEYHRYKEKVSLALDSAGTAWITWGGWGNSDSLRLAHRTAANTYSSEVVTSTGVFRPTMAWDRSGNLNIVYMNYSNFSILFKQRSSGGSYTSEETVNTSTDSFAPADNGPSLAFDPIDGLPMVNWITGYPGPDPNWNVMISKRTGTNTWTSIATNHYTLPGFSTSQSYPTTISGQSPSVYVDYVGNIYEFMGRIDSQVDGSTSYSYVYTGTYNKNPAAPAWSWPSGNGAPKQYSAVSTNCSTATRYDVLNPGSVLDVDWVGCYEGYTSPSTAYLVYAHGSIMPNTSRATPIICPNIVQTGNNANCVQPPVLAFGNQGTGTTSMAIPISYNNCASSSCGGSGGVILASPTYYAFTGTNASDFALSGGTCGAGIMVPSGSYCTLYLTFRPGASGSRIATLTIYDNSSAGSKALSLTGTGRPGAPVASLSTTSLSFDHQNVGRSSASQAVTLTNTGNVNLAIASVSTTETNTGDFPQTRIPATETWLSMRP